LLFFVAKVRQVVLGGLKTVILDGHAINPGDLSWDAPRSAGDLEVFDRTPEDTIVLRAAKLRSC
jgi:hypothetical protein